MFSRLAQPIGIVSVFAVAMTAGCSSSSRTAVGPSPVKCQVTLASAADTVGSNGGGGTVDVTTNPECAWAATPTATWISNLSPASGQGNGQIQYRAAANPQPSTRQAEIDVNGSRVSIRQDATPCQFDITPSTQSIDESGGSGTIALTTIAGCGWNAASNDDWIAVTSGQSGNRSGSIAFRVDANPGGERRGTLTIADDTFTVIQEGALVCAYTLEPPEEAVDGAGGQSRFVVATQPECGWTATSNAPWISVISGATGSGRAPVGYAFAPNPGTTRSGTIAVGNVTFTVTQRPAVESCTFSIAPTSRTAGAAGGVGAPVAVTAANGCTWSAASNVPWLAIASGANGSGNGSVTYVVSANPGAARSGTLTIANQTFTVSQDAEPVACNFALTPSSRSIAATGGTGSFAVSSAGCAWTAVSTVPWITINAGAAGNGNGAVGYSVAPNGGASRSGTITVANQTFTVQQDAAASSCSYSISPGRDTLDAGGGSGAVITVSTADGCAWTAVSNDSWLSITFGASGTGGGGVRFTAAANTGGERTGTLTVAGNSFVVTQRAAPTSVPCTFAVSPTSASVGQLGGPSSATVTTSAGCAWTASSNDSWITVISGATGNGNGIVAYTVAPNLGAARNGSLTVAGRTVSVSQAALLGPTCSYSIAPGQQSVGASGGSGNTVTVTTSAGCAWTASSNASWLTIASGGSGSGSGSVVFSVDANSSIARVGTITIAGQTFTVNQSAGTPAPCTFNVSPSNQPVGALGGTTSFTVTTGAGCTWSASSQASWISITSGGSGSGSGTVTVSVGLNLLGQRTGTLSIAGQSVSVTQSGVLD